MIIAAYSLPLGLWARYRRVKLIHNVEPALVPVQVDQHEGYYLTKHDAAHGQNCLASDAIALRLEGKASRLAKAIEDCVL